MILVIIIIPNRSDPVHKLNSLIKVLQMVPYNMFNKQMHNLQCLPF